MDRKKLKSILESVIFVSEEPITLKRLTEVVEKVEKDELREALVELERDCTEQCRGLILQEVAGGYQFRTPADNSPYVGKLFEGRPQKLTKAALETMAIIAYKQPVVRMEVEKIRGVDSGGVIKTLLERELVRIVGRQDVPGRPALYATTEKFLEFFGLKNLSDMPSLREMTALGDAAEENIADEAQRDNAEQQPEQTENEQPGAENRGEAAENNGGESPEEKHEE